MNEGWKNNIGAIYYNFIAKPPQIPKKEEPKGLITEVKPKEEQLALDYTLLAMIIKIWIK